MVFHSFTFVNEWNSRKRNKRFDCITTHVSINTIKQVAWWYVPGHAISRVGTSLVTFQVFTRLNRIWSKEVQACFRFNSKIVKIPWVFRQEKSCNKQISSPQFSNMKQVYDYESLKGPIEMGCVKKSLNLRPSWWYD